MAAFIAISKGKYHLESLSACQHACLARDLFFSVGMSEEKVRDYQARMSDESFRGFPDMLFLNLPKPELISTPMLVMGAANDRYL